jgi:hypothetical protein
MKKLLLLLFLIPNLVMGRVCSITESPDEDAYDKLQKCKIGQQLFITKLTDGTKFDIDGAKMELIWRRAEYCDLRHEAFIDQHKTSLYLTCIFRNHPQE